jgi:CTP:molybdopterin cytidylyltransferase MocA
MNRANRPVVAGAVLAAGLGTRMGRPKADLVVDGVRLVDRAVGALRGAGCTPVIAVLPIGSVSAADITVVNPDPARGLRSSLQLAFEAATAAGVDAIAVLLADQPGIGADVVARVVARWQPDRIAMARSAQWRGHPVVMAPRLWTEALAAAGADEGARAFLEARPDLVDAIDVDADPALLADLDTAADLTRWQQRGR